MATSPGDEVEVQKPPLQASAAEKDRAPTTPEGQPSGWRLNLVLAATFVGLCLSLLDTTIVAVSLPTIAEHFDEFDRSTWIINAYLITYMAFSIVIARMSDIFSCRSVQAVSFIIFIAFSLGCALSTSMTQLIVFRALQGMGGSGLYSMTMVIVPSLTPPQKRSMIGAYIALCVTTSGVLGPILGGAITNHQTSSTWPWIFWINLPVAGVALAVFLLAWPTGQSRKALSFAALLSIDFLGCLLLLAASTLLVFALLEAGTYQFEWNSPAIIACLVLSAASLVAFILWQIWIASHPAFKIKVVFPVNTITQRVVAAGMIATFLSGFVYYVAIVNLPERFQIVSQDTPIIAGIRLLPMLVFSGIGAIIGGAASARRNNTSYTLIAASAFQLLGYGLMTTLGLATEVPAKQYGFQIFLGLGFGMTMSSATQMMHLQVALQWLAVTQGALAQLRSLGGSIGLAIAVIIFNSRTRASAALTASLTPAQISSLYKSPIVVETFLPQQQVLVAEVFARAFTEQMRVAAYVSAVCLVVSLMTWERVPPEMPRVPRPPMTTTTTARLGHAMPPAAEPGGLVGEQRDGMKKDGPGTGPESKDDRQERD